MSREKTPEEVRAEFIEHVRSLVSYWELDVKPETPIRERLDGLAHSILVTIDGCSCNFPIPLTLVTDVGPDHRKEREENEDDWYPDGCDINSGVHLHYEYFREERERRTRERIARGEEP